MLYPKMFISGVYIKILSIGRQFTKFWNRYACITILYFCSFIEVNLKWLCKTVLSLHTLVYFSTVLLVAIKQNNVSSCVVCPRYCCRLSQWAVTDIVQGHFLHGPNSVTSSIGKQLTKSNNTRFFFFLTQSFDIMVMSV